MSRLSVILLLTAGFLLLAACGEPGPHDLDQTTPTAAVNLPLVGRPGAASPTVTPLPTPGTGRPWPDTSNGIHVFNDQLYLYGNPAWVSFAATHYAGTQKMTRADADALRAVNPNFLILHYRLGIGLGYRAPDASCQPTGEYLTIIEGNDWVQEWPGDAVVQPEWFFPHDGSPRVYQCDWGWYLMAVDNASWRTWWSGEVLRQLAANDDDGLFADSVSVPNYMGGFSPALPDYDPAFEAAWTDRLEGWMDYMRGRFAGRYVLLPNAGSWVNGRDATDYAHADGVMIEGFGYDAWTDFGAADWRLQMDRTLGLVQQGKIVLAQAYYNDAADPTGRLFTLGSYLLLKGARTYLDLEWSMEPEWWPEYAIPLGTYVGGIPASMDALYDGSVYRRAYTNGLVLVNPGGGDVTVSLGGTYQLAQPPAGMGGVIPDDGQIPPTWAVSYTPVTQVTLAPGTAAILVITP